MPLGKFAEEFSGPLLIFQATLDMADFIKATVSPEVKNRDIFKNFDVFHI